MQRNIFRKGKKGKNENIRFLLALCFFLSLSPLSFSLISCGGDGGGGGVFLPSGDDNIGANEAPLADFTVAPNVGAAPLVAGFDASGSHDPDGDIIYYEWDFENDGMYDAAGPDLVTVTHTYDTPGQKIACLRVTDDRDGVAEIRKNIVVFPGWVRTKGPCSGSFFSLTLDPTNSEVLYSFTRKKEVYKSTDGGLTWIYFPTIDSETKMDIRGEVLEIGPTDNQIFYLGTGSQGMYKSTDAGETWVHISNGLPKDKYGFFDVNQILIDPTDLNLNTVYVGLDMGYLVYKTVDGGQNWFKINDQTTDLTPVQDLLIDPLNTQTVYIGLWHYVNPEPHPEKGGVWKSTDGGLTWGQECGTCPSCLPRDIFGNWAKIQELAIDYQEPLRIYAGSSEYGLYRTDNGGDTWGYLTIGDIPDYDHTEIQSLELDPNDRLITYVGLVDSDDHSNDGLWVTTDGGWNWTQYFPGTGVGVIRIAPSDSTIFVHADRWYRRNSPDDDWQEVNSDGIIDVRVSVLSNVLPDDKGFIYAGTELGVYLTTDGGENWELLRNEGLKDEFIYTLVMDPNDDRRVFVGTIDGVFLWDDGQKKWMEKNIGLTAWGAFTLAMDPTNSDILYVGTSDGIFKSFDGGENWIEKGDFPYAQNSVWRLAIAPHAHLVLYASVEDSFGTEGKIFKSINGGESWQDVSGNLPTDIAVWGIAISRNDSNVVYVGIDGYGVYKTVDGGSTWELINSGLKSTSVACLAMSQEDDQTLFAGTRDEGAFATIDGGENWYQMDKGLISNSNRQVCSFALDISDIDNPVVYAGTGCGVFKAYK